VDRGVDCSALTAPPASVPMATATELVPMAQKYLGRFVHFVKKIGDGLAIPKSFCLEAKKFKRNSKKNQNENEAKLDAFRFEAKIK
jgi:hypothetical protein